MKKLYILALLFLSGCAAVPPSDGSITVKVSAERAAECRAQGGCGLFSEPQILELMQQAYDLGVAAAKGGI